MDEVRLKALELSIRVHESTGFGKDSPITICFLAYCFEKFLKAGSIPSEEIGRETAENSDG